MNDYEFYAIYGVKKKLTDDEFNYLIVNSYLDHWELTYEIDCELDYS